MWGSREQPYSPCREPQSRKRGTLVHLVLCISGKTRKLLIALKRVVQVTEAHPFKRSFLKNCSHLLRKSFSSKCRPYCLLKTKYLEGKHFLGVFGGASPKWSLVLCFGVCMSALYTLAAFSLINFIPFMTFLNDAILLFFIAKIIHAQY